VKRGTLPIGGLLLLLAAACAHVEPPPGGLEDREPPRLLVSRPDSLAVVPGFTAPVVLVFDERISERGIEQAVMVSPRTSMVRVDHRRDELRVALAGGWQPNTIYHITVLPEIQDLFGNRRTEPVNFVFSTGPPIPDTRLSGRVTDRITGRNEANVRVEAIRMVDSLVYALPTDSAGRFSFHRIPEGEYRVRAFQDMNRDRRLDPFEPRDTAFATVTTADTSSVALALLLPDTTPPAIASISVVNQNVEVRFDDHLDPAHALTTDRVSITAADGQAVAIVEMGIGALASAVQDTAAPAVIDTTGARPQPIGVSPAARTLPSRTLVIRVGERAELRPGVEYRVRVLGVRNVNGLVADAEDTFTAPEIVAPQPAVEPGVEPGDEVSPAATG
jgi:hypothetical protein